MIKIRHCQPSLTSPLWVEILMRCPLPKFRFTNLIYLANSNDTFTDNFQEVYPFFSTLTHPNTTPTHGTP